MLLEKGFGGSGDPEEKLQKARYENREPSHADNARAEFDITLAGLKLKEKETNKEALLKMWEGATMFAEAAMKKGNN